ncbi:AAA family ATPase, partial [Actinokineospora enzanensis]|uniref:AAA family ATPase n=1 Tax=Actinokineospora enzanensis TaxID=155975 RepID=UPI000524D3B6
MTAPADTPAEKSARTGPITRARASMAALEVLDRLREERRDATAEERDVLRQWSGWGPMANAFEPDRKAGWKDIGEQLEWLLPPEDQIEARKATPNAFYTPPEITEVCWQLLRGLGFDGGRILEPGCGAGVFMGHTPSDLAGEVSWLGIERDPSTAAIAQAIYPDAEIINSKLEKSKLPTASVDAVLGNVPFADTLIFDPNAPEAVTKNLHNYCIWRSAQSLRPGGVAVLITSRYTLDSADREAREALYANCDLISAVRMPNVAWRSGGTEPVADILVLRRRRPGEEPGDDTWLDAEKVDALDTEVNRLFLSRPDLVVGEHGRDRAAQFGRVLRVDLPEGADWAAELRSKVEPISQEALGRGQFWNVDAAPEPISAENTVLADAEGRKEGSFHLVDGKAHEVRDGLLRPATKRQKIKGTEDEYEQVPLKGKELAEITALIGLRDTTVGVLEAEERAVTQEKAIRDADDTIREQRRELARHEAALRTAMKAEPGADLQTLLFTATHQTWDAEPNVLAEARASAEAWQSADQRLTSAEHTRERASAVIGEINTELGGLRGQLNSRYDNYVGKYGFLNRCTIVEGKPDEETGQVTIQRRRPRMGGFRTDPDYFSVLALEDWDDDTRSATKAAIFSRRVNRAPQRQERADNVGEAIALCLDEHGKLHLPTVARLLDIEVAAVPEAMGDLAFVDPSTGAWGTAEEYLSGNVRTKLDQALAAAETEPDLWTRNVDALREVQPVELGPGEIHAPLGAPWIPSSDVQDFLVELLGTSRPTMVRREPLTSTWEVKVDKRDKTTPEATAEWGTERVHAAKLVELALNGQTPTVTDTIRNPDGTKETVRNIEATTAAEEKQRQVTARFLEWIWEEPERADRLAERYNRLFNSTVLRRYDGAHLTFPGLAEGFDPYPHQRDMVYQAISTQTALCGHAVGGGKTTIMFMTAMKMRQLGLVTKPMIVVPKHLLEQTAREGKQRFPGAKILVADENDMSDARSRKLFAARCATGDWDAVIVTHPAFTRIPMHERNEADYLSELAAKYRASLAAVMASEDAEDDEFSKPGRRTKQVEKLIDSLEARVEYLLEHSHDDGVRFEHLGVDHLLVDEFHYFKNLMVPCHTEGFSMSSSKRATDMDMKLTWLRSRYDRVGTFYTGTAVSNSLLELYIVLHYLMPERLEEIGIDSPDAWAAWCVQFETNVEIGPDGVTPRLNRRPSTFKNVRELLQLFAERSDIRTQEDLGLKVPEVEHENVVSTASPIQRAYIHDLARRAENCRGSRAEKGGDNMLKVCTDGRKVAVDPALVGLGDPFPGKIDDVVENASRIFHQTAELQFPADSKHAADAETGVRGAFQIVFCDLGTPGKERGDQVYGKIRDGLIAQGVPREQIRFIHDAGTDAQKAKLFADCRSGKVSVLIGSTDKLGVGTNIQSRAVALHHLDAPWRPADVEQREGRVRRPGNRMLALQQERARRLAAGEEVPASWPEKVQIFRYVTEGSFDGYMWQTLERKARFIAQVLSGKIAAGQREIDDIGEVTLSFAEVKALATGNPMLMDLAKVKADVARLSSLAASHTRTQKRLTNNISRDQREIRDNGTLAKALEGITRTVEHAVGEARVEQRRLDGQPPADDDEVVTPWTTQAGKVLGEDKDIDTALAALAAHAVKTKRHSEAWLNWRGLRVGFELRDQGWRRQVLSAVINTGSSPHRGEHRVEVNAKWLAKGQQYRFRQAVVGAVESAATRAVELRETNEQLTKRIESSRAQLGKPFTQAGDLNAARERLEEINTELRKSTEPKRPETATPAESVVEPDIDLDLEDDDFDPELAAMVMHDAQAMAGILGDDVQVMVNARHVPRGYDEAEARAHYRDAAEAEEELSALTAQVINLPQDYPGHEQAVTSLVRAKRLHGFALTVDEHLDRSVAVPIPGLGTSTKVSGAEVPGTFGRLAEAAARGQRSGHVVWRGLRIEIGHRDEQLLAAVSIDGDPEYPNPVVFEDVPLEEGWAEPDQHWQILRALDRFVDSAADRSRAERRRVSGVLEEHHAAAGQTATSSPETHSEISDAAEAADDVQSSPAATEEDVARPAPEPADRGIDPLTDAMMEATDLADRLLHLAEDDPANQAFSDQGLEILRQAAVPLGIAVAADQAPGLDATRSGPPPAHVPADQVDQVLAEVAGQAINDPRQAEHVLWRGLRIEFGFRDDQFVAAVSRDGDDNYDSPVWSSGANFLAVPLETRWAHPARHWRIRAAIDEVVRSAPEHARAGLDQVAALLAEHDAASLTPELVDQMLLGFRPETAEASPDTPDRALAGQDLVQLLGLTAPQAQWLHRQFVALAQHVDVRDAERTVPEAMPRFFQGALDLKLDQPIRAERSPGREQPDPVGLEVARRYAGDRPFAALVSEVGIERVRTMINRDLVAELPELVDNLFADLALQHTDQDAEWIRRWIIDAAADPRMLQSARVNSEDNFAQVLGDHLIDTVVAAMDGDNPPNDTMLDYLLDNDYVGQRWRDLARSVVYDIAHGHGVHAPPEPAAAPATTAPAADQGEQPQTGTPDDERLDDDQELATEPDPADAAAPREPSASPSTGADDAQQQVVRTLTLHYSFERGVMLLGTDRGDGIADLLRPDRAGWKWRRVDTPTGEPGAWLLPKTLRVQRDARSMTRFHERLIARLTGAGDLLTRAGFAVRLDLHDLPDATARSLHAWESRTHVAAAQPQPEASQDTGLAASGETRSSRAATAVAGEPTAAENAADQDEAGSEIPASGGTRLAPELLTMLNDHGWVGSGFIVEHGQYPAPMPHSYSSDWQRGQQRLQITWSSTGEVSELRLNGRAVPLTFPALRDAVTSQGPAASTEDAATAGETATPPDPVASDDLNRELLALYEEMHGELAAAGYTHRRLDTVSEHGVDHSARTVTTDPRLPLAQEMTALADLVDVVRTHRHQLDVGTHRQYADAMRAGLAPDVAARANDLLGRAGELDALARRTATASRSEQPFVIPRERGIMARQLNEQDLAPTLLGFARAAQRGISPQTVLSGLIPADHLTWRGAKVWFETGEAGLQIQLACAAEGGFDTIAVPEEWLGRDDGGQLLVDAVTGAASSAAGRADEMRAELAVLLSADDRADALESGPQIAAATTAVELPTLRELRAVATEHDLQVRVVRVADAAFVAVHEPSAPNPSVLCWPVGSAQAFDGAGRPMPVESAAEHLATYRGTVAAELFTARPGLQDWARRLAQLTPHMLPGPEQRPEVRQHVDEALALSGADPREAENLLRRAENVAGPLALTPEREAQVVREIHDHASGYAWAGDVGRYLTDPGHLDGSTQEWDWITAYVADHPEVKQGHPDHDGIQARNAAERAEQEQLGAALSREANVAFRVGEFERALDLLDQAELAYPGNLPRWAHARNVVTDAMTAAQPAQAEQGELLDAAALDRTGSARSRRGTTRGTRRGTPSPVLGEAGLAVWQAFHRAAAEGTEPPTVTIPRRRIDGEITVSPGHRRLIVDAGWPPPGERTAPRGPLTEADVALALLRVASLAPSAFGQVVAQAADPGDWGGPGFMQGHRATARGEGEPDIDQTDRVIAWGTHVEVEVGHLRAGAVRWDELAAWLRPGLTEDHTEFFAQAIPVWRRFHQRHDGAVLSPEAQAAGEELLQVLDTVVAEVLTSAVRAHLAPGDQGESAVASVVAQARERVTALAEAAPADVRHADVAAEEATPPAPAEQEQGLPTAVEQAADPTLITPEYQIALHARVNAEAVQWYDDQLDASPTAQRYVRDRLGTQAAVDQVRRRAGADGGLAIGFAPNGWTGLVEHLRGKGFRDQDLVDAGVASVVRNGPRQGQLIDRFRNRIMFGIRDGEGRMAGFIGRDLSGTADAKYLNSPASALFDKSSLLLGLYEQRDLAGHAVPVFVEGPFDVAAIIATARPDRPLMPIAPCGTALTNGHLDAVDALVPVDRRRVFALDGDEAGRKAVLARAEDAVRRYEDLDITTLPNGLDPADFAKTVGVEEQVAAYLGAPYSLPAMEVLVEARLRLWDEQLQWVEGRVGAARHVAALLATVEPQRITDLALNVAIRLNIEPVYMAEYILEAREGQGEVSTQRPTLSSSIATSERERRDERPGADSPTQQAPDTGVEAAPAEPEADSAAARDNERPAELDGQQEPAEPPVDQRSAETVAARSAEPQPEPEATDTAAEPEVAVAPEPDTPSSENRDAPNVNQPGPWTRRIVIEVSGNTAVVSGTAGGDPKVLRETFKDNGFRWRPNEGQVWKFFPRRGGPSRDEAVQSIRDVLADLDAKAAAKASPAPSYPPTPQQQAIIDACLDGRDVAVRALAGTGKTSTMRMVAARMPDKKITYVAFNRAIADEAQAAFGPNVTADTFHAFARKALRSNPRYQAKLGKIDKNDGFPEEIAAVLGHDRYDGVRYGPQGTEEIEVTSLVRLAQGTVKRFRESADAEIGFRHVGESAAADTTGLSTLVLDYARRIWADKTDPDGQLRFVHDDYRKIWALGNPTIPGDVIIFDEVQDVNELQARLVQAQSAQTIVVGDSYQSIYGFTGAKDFLRNWPADVTLPLTQSWRFGPNVAEVGNQFLGLLRARLTLEGNPGLDTRLEQVPDPDAVLCRTNAAAVAAVIDAMDDGKRVALVGGGDAIKDIAKAAQDLMRGRSTKHPDLAMFGTWGDVREYVNQHEEAQSLKMLVRLVDQHRPEGLIQMAQDLIDEDETDPDLKADLVVSTAHKAKGREWNAVRIADDFRGPTEDPETGEEILPQPEELRLAYVTVTRAQRRLELGSLEWILSYGQQASAEPASATTEQRAAEVDLDVVQTPETPALVASQPKADNELAPAEAPQAAPEIPVALPEQVAQVETASTITEQPVGAFPMELQAGDLDNRDALLRRLRECLESLPREIDGVPTGPVHLALAVAGSALTTGDAFPVRTTVLRVTGNDEFPLLTAHRLSQFADLIDAAVPDLTQQRNALGFYQDDRSLAGHLRAISSEIERVVNDPVALARARAAKLFDSFTVNAVRSVHGAITVGDSDSVNEFFGPTSLRGRLIEPAALQVLRDAFVAQATRTRFEPGQRGQAEVELGNGLDTGIALQALAAEARNRARFADATGRVLRAAGIATIADNLDAVAGSMATAGNFVLPDEINAEPQDTDQPSADNVVGEQANDRPGPLLPYDVAFMLRNMSGGEFARVVRTIGDDVTSFSRGGEGGFQGARGDDEPDPGAPVRVRYNTKAVVIEVDAGEEPRAGRITWKRLQDWIAVGLTPATRQVLLDADDAHSAFAAAQKGFIAAGERELAQAARQELGGYRDEAITAVIGAALAEHEKGGRARRRRAAVNADALIAVDGVAGVSEQQRSVLDRIAALTAVLPVDVETLKRLSQIEVGDVVEHPGYLFSPFRITEQPVVHEDAVDLVGDLLDYNRREPGPTTWQFSTAGEADPQLRMVPRPKSLVTLMTQEDQAPEQALPSAGPAVEVERIEVPEDLDLAEFGWERVDLSYNEHGPIERWARDSTELTLGWESTDDDLLLATPIVLNGREHPISSIEEFLVVVLEAGQHGFARPSGTTWTVTATPTAAYAHDVVDGGELLRLVTLDAQQGWVFVESGEAVQLADPAQTASRSRPAAPARPAAPTPVPEAEQFSLWDAPEEPEAAVTSAQPEPEIEPVEDVAQEETIEADTAGPAPQPVPSRPSREPARGLAIESVRFVPTGSGDDLPIADQIAAMEMPSAVRLDEPARLAFVHAQRAVREPTVTPAQRATIVNNISGGWSGEAAAVAEQMDALAALVDASGQDDRIEDGELGLAEHLRATSTEIRRLAGVDPADQPAALQVTEAAATMPEELVSETSPSEPQQGVPVPAVIADGPHPDPTMKWAELVDLAKSLGFTVVKTQSAQQVATNHDLNTIAVPWETESTNATDLLFDELARLTGLAGLEPEPATDDPDERQAELDTRTA